MDSPQALPYSNKLLPNRVRNSQLCRGLTDADLTGAGLADAKLDGTILTGANLSGVRSGGITGSPSALPTDWQLTSGYLIGPTANLTAADLSGANLDYANLSGANLTDADLTGADLNNADLTGADLDDANLRNTDLSWTNLQNATLYDAVLNGADLTGALLSNADLSLANFSDADLSWVIADHAVLEQAFFSGANLDGALLIGADLSDSILAWALNYNTATWTDAFYYTDNEPTWDSGMTAAWRDSVGILAIDPTSGDFNGDGVVDAADYTVWRDGDSPDSTTAGYALWVENFGQSSASGSGADHVPEPTTLLLALLALTAVPLRVRQR